MTRNSPIVLFVMVKFIIWGAFALGLKACLSNLWTFTSDTQHLGLWKTCTTTATSKDCERIGRQTYCLGILNNLLSYFIFTKAQRLFQILSYLIVLSYLSVFYYFFSKIQTKRYISFFMTYKCLRQFTFYYYLYYISIYFKYNNAYIVFEVINLLNAIN